MIADKKQFPHLKYDYWLKIIWIQLNKE
jgi:hypothetical protein